MSVKKPKVMCVQTPRIPVKTMRVEDAGQRYKQVVSFDYLEGTGSENPDVSAETTKRARACWMCIDKNGVQLYDRPTVPLDPKAG